MSRIVIVGGGSAGWMTAATLVSQFPNKEIVVIESPNVPTVGVGESTITGINNWCNLIGIKDTDFMKSTDASYKLGIKFTNFYTKDSGSFHYPFGVTDTDGNISGRNEWYFKKMKYPETPNDDYMQTMFPVMALINSNRIVDDGRLKNFRINSETAFHFDAIKFGIWLRDVFCTPKGVEHIRQDVTDVMIGDDGIDHLVLGNGDHVTADLFIDCTGFRSLLLGGALKEPFDSYDDILPNNSAWATSVPYTNKREQLITCTECEAIQNGWAWNIPLWSRIGTGYVYSNAYVTDEQALDEFKDHLRQKGLYSEGLTFKNLKMRIGIHRRLWVKNVCAIGLSAGFIEPLESSGLFTVHEFLIKLVRTLNRGETVSQWDRNAFSTSCVTQFRTFAEFVALHYALSHRDDTPYWRANKNRTYFEPRVYVPFTSAKELTGFDHAVESRYERFHFGNDNSGAHCIFTGMNYFPFDRTSLIAHTIPVPENEHIDFRCKVAAEHLNAKRTAWAESVKDAPMLIDFLEKMYS